MKISKALSLGATGLGVLLIAGCILDGNSDKPVAPPSGFSYSMNGAFFAPGVPIVSDTPKFAVGTAHRFSISPPLSSGLVFDTATGIISGTPAAEVAAALYTITAKNDTVSLMTTVTLTISHWVGLPKDSLLYAAQLLLSGGEIFVANRSATNPGVAVIDTGAGKVTAYYPEQLPPMGMALTPDNHLIITETNFFQGAVSVVDLPVKSIQKSVVSFGSDNFADTAGGRVFLFDRTTGVVTGFTGHVPGQNVVFDVQTGTSSNPYAIAISNNRAFVTRYNSNSLLVLDATRLDGGLRDSIDLSAYVSRHPADTIAPAPRMTWVTACNGYVFVALQRLNYKYSALDTSLVVVINASTKQVVSVIPLHFKNPVSAHVVGGMWYLTGIANYDQSGGVEKIDLVQRLNAGSLVTAQSLSADIFDFAPTGDHAGYVAYSSDYGYTTRVKKVSY